MTRCGNLMKNLASSSYWLWTKPTLGLVKAVNRYYKYVPTAVPQLAWPVPDTENWGATSTLWKFWAEWLHSAAISCTSYCNNLGFEQAYNSFNAQALKAFGEAPGPTYRWLPFP